MSTLLLRLSGPMQAWGTQSRFRHRDTGLEPSKSGVIGLLCSALGRPRESSVDDLAALRFGVRVDREGVLKVDYHTAGAGYVNGRVPGGRAPAGVKTETGIITQRYYLADASFLVGLEGPFDALAALEAAMAKPVWQLFLGRKAFTPGYPIRLPAAAPEGPGLRVGSLADELEAYPALPDHRPFDVAETRTRFVLDAGPGQAGEVRNDVPLSFANRSFGSRRVQTFWREVV